MKPLSIALTVVGLVGLLFGAGSWVKGLLKEMPTDTSQSELFIRKVASLQDKRNAKKEIGGRLPVFLHQLLHQRVRWLSREAKKGAASCLA